MIRRRGRARALVAGAFFLAAGACAQEWYIPKRTRLLKGGALEAGARAQLSANNDGLLDTLRLDLIPSLRYSPLGRLELYGELPFSYAEREDVVAFALVKNQTTGIGDAFGQVSYEAFAGEDWKVLVNMDGSFPTGKTQFKHRVPLGGAHFALAAGQTAMKVIDPVVLFAHLGYQHTFPRRFAAGRIAPGRAIRYRFGTALSLNPRVQTTFHVTGDSVSTTRIEGKPVAGSSGTLMRLGWGLDWTLSGSLRLGMDAIFGMTKNTNDATLALGLNWRIF